MAEYALVTAVVASLAISLATLPEAQLARQLPVTAARAQALVSKSARTSGVPVARARSALAHAPYGRAPLSKGLCGRLARFAGDRRRGSAARGDEHRS